MHNSRLRSMDILRGMALMFIILFHSSIYNYANIDKIDFSNPPLLIVLMSFMALWGGIFIIYSTVTNTVMILRRNQRENNIKTAVYLTIAGALYLFFHYILNIFLGRWNIDFINNKPDMTFIAGTLRNMHLSLPSITKIFEGSSLSTIALNLIILSWVLFFLLKNNGVNKAARNYLWLGIPGFLIMILSFARVFLYSQFTQAIESNNYFLGILYSFILANPYPLLPYLAYGFFGALIGLMIFNNRKDLLKKVIVPVGIFFVLFGLLGILNFQKTISKPDYFWYFKTNFELGLFLLMLIFAILFFEHRIKFLSKMIIPEWFSRISLTIYMLETFISEIFRIILHSFLPNWDQTINGCLAFGAFNIIIWIIILFFWKKANFKYSLEYFWVIFFNKIGKSSTKMDFL